MSVREYEVYGLSVRSELPLTFRERAARRADVTFSMAPPGWFAEMSAHLAPERGDGDWYERRCAPDGSDFLRFPDLCECAVSPDGRGVACGLLDRATSESFQTYLLGPVLAYALVKQGLEPLHATTVVVDGRAIGFLAASGAGKSTLAAAFLAAGHRLLTDDLLLIRDIDGAPHGFPGPPRIKLLPDAARALLPRQAAASRMNPEAEKLIVALDRDQCHAAPARLDRFVVLDDGHEPAHGAVEISTLARGYAMLHLLRSAFNRRIVSRARMRRQFASAAAWARRIPVRRVVYTRRLDAIADVRDAILR